MIPRLHRYVASEALRGTAAALAAVMMLVVLGIVYSYWHKGYSAVLGEVCLYSLPQAFGYALPVAYFAGVLLAVSRIAASSELTVIRAGGLSLVHLYAPLLAAGAVLACLLAVVWDRAVPWGEKRIERVTHEAAFDMLRSLDPNRRGRLVLDDMTINFLPASPDGKRPVEMVRESEGGRRFVHADHSVMEDAPDGGISVKLVHGFVIDEGSGDYPRTNFDTLTFTIPPPSEDRPPRTFTLPFRALLAEAERAAESDPALARKYLAHAAYTLAASLAVFFMVFPALPLGLLLAGGGRLAGVSAALAYVFVVYYPLLLGGKFLARRGAMDPWLALQAPNAAGLVVGLVLYLAVARKGLMR